MKRVLITGSLFVLKKHEDALKKAGYQIQRIQKPLASEEELIEAIRDKDAYILSGVEKVTNKVIEAAPKLKVIAFTGSDWKIGIPDHELATKKGIHISNAPGSNKYAVAEYTIAIILSMTRNLFELTRTGETKSQTTQSLSNLTIGILGMGKIGKIVANMLNCLGVKKVIYWSPNKKDDVNAEFKPLKEVLKESDILSLHFSSNAGFGFIDKEKLSMLKDNALIINCGFTGAINEDDLYEELKTERIRAFQDNPIDERFDKLPIHIWNCSNIHTAYKTTQTIEIASDQALESLLNLLNTGEDKNKVN